MWITSESTALRVLLGLCWFVLVTDRGWAQATDPFVTARNRLVDQEIVGAGIKNPHVIAAIRATPRHEFVSPKQKSKAYFDMALPIDGGQTISPPYIVAFMTEQLNPQPSDRVLEIGTGSGYQAAVLSEIVDEVYSIEIVDVLGRKSARTLRRLNYDNVYTKIGDGYLGWPEHAPFDKIIVTCSPENVPQPLVDQLVEGGLMIVPVGERFQQTLWRYTKKNGRLEHEHLQATFFVPMTGRAESERQKKPNSTLPHLVNGGFEKELSKTKLPSGWYYVRQGQLDSRFRPPQGATAMRFHNVTAGRHAHAMQAFGVDGRQVREIEISYWIRGHDLKTGRSIGEQAGFILEFYGPNRAPIKFIREGHENGDLDWTHKSIRSRVPSRARLAVIGIGLFGATGEAMFDEVTIRPLANRATKKNGTGKESK